MDTIIQGSDEWRLLRCGKITASKIADVMQKGKGVGYANYMAQLACERLTGCVTDGFKSAYMERGNEDEAAARLCYEFITGRNVEQVAFVPHHKYDFAGMSPDGLIGAEGLLEIKRKIPALHIAYLLKGEVPSDYRKQMTWQLACMPERQWVDFASYCPELPEEMQLFTVRMHRDDIAIAEMEAAVIEFNNAVNKMIADLIAAAKERLEKVAA